ncbi:hypothetical protein [Agromyces sp. H66]|uniref:hypothetical protein n=1 Tax=Agromyces sp. H66 TaxID=2529859 RepID=UPI0010AB48CC|nr:hypothetical protein [Agromyces sp. H66]
MNDALGMYLVIKAEHEAVLAEFAERRRRRGLPRAASRTREGSAAANWLRRLWRSGHPDAAPTTS